MLFSICYSKTSYVGVNRCGFPYMQVISGKWNKDKKQGSLQVVKVTVVNEKTQDHYNCCLNTMKQYSIE